MAQTQLRRRGAAQLAAQNRRPDSVSVSHWHQVRLNALNWNKSFPYQLLVLKKLPGGGWEQDDAWQFTLPISPQELSISTPFAFDLNLNENGATEIANPIRARFIRARGTVGVLPLRPTAEQRPFNIARTIFAGTINQISNVAATGAAIARDVVPSNYQPINVLQDSDFQDTDLGRTSGYYQMRLLEQFFERYAELKSTAAGRDRQLAFAIWKDQAVWLITPQVFDVTRGVPHVLRYDYTFQAKAWKRVSLDKTQGAFLPTAPISTTPDKLSRAIATIRDTRRTIYQSRQLIQAAVTDLENLVLEPLREVSLLVQDLAGNTASLADLPRNVIQASKSAVLSLLAARDAVQSLPDSIRNRLAAVGDEVDELRELGALLSKSDTRSADLFPTGALANSPANSIFEEPAAHYEFFSALRPGDLQLNSTTQTAIATERTRVREFTRQDFEDRRAKIQLAADTYASYVGLGSDVRARLLGRPVATPARDPIDSDYEALFALNNAAQVLDALIAHSPRQTTATELSLQYVAGLASAAGIAFQIPQSKFAVPFPYGATLEQLALRYLGDPDRWQEIATLNGLREPYVDELGYTIELTATPSGDRVIVGSDGAGLRAGQPVSLLSTRVPELRTQVLATEKFGEKWMVTLRDDASRFLPSDGAVLYAHLPDTVNSTQQIWIPSDETADEDDFTVRDPAVAADFDPLLRAAGTDLLLSQNNDMVVTPDGDWLYARGLPLVTQVVRTAISTPRGSLLHHPSYGLPAMVGESLADLDAKAQTRAIQDTFADDPLFSAVDAVAVQKGPVSTIGLSLSVKGNKRPVPLSVEMVKT